MKTLKRGLKEINNNVFSFYFNDEDLKKIQKTKIMIVGCGGLGSNVATLLVRTGFINIVLVDYDVVELKNLNRQNYFISDIGKEKTDALKEILLNINPYVRVTTVNTFLDKGKLLGIIKKYSPDIIVEAVDKVELKATIFETALTLKKFLITASGIGGFGDIDKIKIIRRKNYTMIGDLKTESISAYSLNTQKNRVKSKIADNNKTKMPLAPKVVATAAIQADEVLRKILKGG